MKKAVLFLLVFAVTSFYGQASKDSVKKYSNTILVDATALLKQFINTNSSYNQVQYLIGYRRTFGNNAIRVGVGGNTYSSDAINNDTIKEKTSSTQFIGGIGFEHYINLYKNFSWYFGVDIVYLVRQDYYKHHFSTSSYQVRKSNNIGYGIAPLLGIICNFRPRIALSAETSYQVLFKQSDSQVTNYPTQTYNTKSKANRTETQYIPPTTISVRFNF